MRKYLALLAALVVVGAVMAMSAFGGQPVTGNDNNGGQTGTQANCIAAYSSQVIHNGTAVSQQDRQAEIKALQETCAHD